VPLLSIIRAEKHWKRGLSKFSGARVEWSEKLTVGEWMCKEGKAESANSALGVKGRWSWTCKRLLGFGGVNSETDL